MNAVVAERGQVTIPKPLRERLGLGPKTVLDMREENGRLVARKVVDEDPVRRVIGCLKMKESTDAIIGAMRGEP